MGYLSRDAVLTAATTLAEKDWEEPALGGAIRLRELTAEQRQQAQEAAFAAGADGRANNTLYRAIVFQFGVIDPETGAPLLSPEDTAALVKGREEVVNRVAVQILTLSEALPEQLKSGGPAPDEGQPDTGAGD